MLNKLNSPITALLCLMGFVWLAQIALAHQKPMGYDHSIFDVLPPSHSPRHQAIMELWHISEDDIKKPINLFGE